MAASVAVDPSVSRHSIPQHAEDVATVCVLCSHNCGLRVDVRDGRIASVRADERSPITRGYVCNKAFSVPHYAHHEQRVEHPLRRRPDGSFERVSWDEAIVAIAERLGGGLFLEQRGANRFAVAAEAGMRSEVYVIAACSFLGVAALFFTFVGSLRGFLVV